MDLPNFNYPKNIYRNQRNIQSRPQPSPSKTEQFMKELGLDENSSVTSTSSEEDELDEKPSEIEFKILQKELNACNEQCDVLKEKNRELENSLYRLNNRLKKEETSKRMRLKILQRAYHDNIKDKQQLVMNLQELIEESGDTKSEGLVESIEKLHREKAKLHQELLKAQENYEDQLNDMEERYSGSGHPLLDSASVQALEKVTEEKIRLLMEMEKIKEVHANEVTSYEDLIKEKESELIRANQEKEKKTRSYNSIKLKLETLRRETDDDKRTRHEKERELESMLKNQEDEAEKLKSENKVVQKQLATLELEMTSRLNSELSESSAKSEEEKRKLRKELDRCRMEISELREKRSELATLRQDMDKIGLQNEELKADLLKCETELNQHKTSAREKLRFAEHELEECQLALQQQRRSAANDLNELKQLLERNEKEHKREVDEANQACREQKKHADQAVQCLEEKLRKSKTKLKSFEEEIFDLKQEKERNGAEISGLQRDVESANGEIHKVMLQLNDQASQLESERKNCDELSSDLRRTKVEKESFERQLSVLSGKSDSVISRMETESRELRLQITSLEEKLRVAEREKDERGRLNKELETKITDLDHSLHSGIDRHKMELEKIAEVHKRELMKLKASSAIANEALTSRNSSLESALRLALSTLQQMSHDRKLLRTEVERFPVLLKEAIKRAAKQVSEAVSEINETNKDLVRRYTKEMTLRKKYHNELVELRGNIRVFVRARPIISEDGKNAKEAVSYDLSDDAIIYVNNTQKGRSQTFEVDRVFPGSASQEQVYAEVQALVTSCIDGYHVCIFAYGQTGSGKTHSMEGTADQPGINQRALDDLFRMIDDRSRDWDYSVKVSLVEIYNETLRDLLNAKSEKLEIKMNPDGSLYVLRLKQFQVKNLDDVNRVFRTGRSNRATASTNMNERSSRSHAVLMVTVEGTNKTTETSTVGRLNLIDLAGSERVSKSGASGDRLKEAQNINRSLSALGDVIHALRNKQGHVPFRNSKLTYLLQDSLSKESKTLMLVQVSPIQASLGETVCSLNFAQRVRTVELGQATKKTKSLPSN